MPRAYLADAASDERVTAREWFASGARRRYDPIGKTAPRMRPATSA